MPIAFRLQFTAPFPCTTNWIDLPSPLEMLIESYRHFCLKIPPLSPLSRTPPPTPRKNELQNCSYSYCTYSPIIHWNVFVEPACGERDIVVTMTVRASVRNCPDHNFYNCGWISK